MAKLAILSGIVFILNLRKIFFCVKDLLKQQGLECKPKLTMLCALYATMFGAFGTFAICASIYTIILLLSGEGNF